MVDTLSLAVGIVEIDRSELMTTEINVEVVRSLFSGSQSQDMTGERLGNPKGALLEAELTAVRLNQDVFGTVLKDR